MVLAEAEWRDPEQVEAWSTGLPKNKLVAIYCVHGGSVSNIKAQYIEGCLAA